MVIDKGWRSWPIAVRVSLKRHGGGSRDEDFGEVGGPIGELGGSLQDVIRTRIFLTPECSWEGAASAHAEIFRGIDPANTSLYVSGLFVPGALVEVEVDAIVSR